MHSVDLPFPDRPPTTEFLHIAWQTRVLSWLTAILIRPLLFLFTVAGWLVNRVRPDVLQRARLNVIDKPLRLVPPLPGTEVTPVSLPTCPAEWVVAPTAVESRRVIVYFHGSALVTLGLNSHRRFVSKLSGATAAQVLNVDYRLAPQASIDDATADGLSAYRHVLAAGYDPAQIVLAGDSAGGLIATNTAIAARDAGLPTPAGQVLLSPLASGDMDIKHRAATQHRDVMFPFRTIRFLYEVFVTANGTREVPTLPAESDLRGLGPFLLQTSAHELLRNDTFVLADRLVADEVPVWVQVWHRAMHVFQVSFDVNPDARVAIGEITAFVDYITSKPSSSDAASA